MANHVLYPTTGHGMGYLGVAMSFGFAFTFAIMAFGSVSAMLNPAAAISLLVSGNIKVDAFFVAIVAEVVGAFLGGLTLYLIYTPQLHKPGSPNFSYRVWIETSRASIEMGREARKGRKASKAALAAKKAEIAAEHAAKRIAKAKGEEAAAIPADAGALKEAEAGLSARDKVDVETEIKEFGAMEDTDDDPFLGIWVTRPAVWAPLQSFMTEFIFTFIFLMLVNLTAARGQYLYQPSYGLYANIMQPVVIGFIIAASILAAGPTGFAGNPARDLGPRLAHWILPLPKSKRIGSEWRYAWIPVVAPLCAGACAGGLYQAWLPQLKGTVKADTNPFSTVGTVVLPLFTRAFAFLFALVTRADAPRRAEEKNPTAAAARAAAADAPPPPPFPKTKKKQNALAATSIEQQVKSDLPGNAASLVLGQDTQSSQKTLGAAVKSAVGASKKSGAAAKAPPPAAG